MLIFQMNFPYLPTACCSGRRSSWARSPQTSCSTRSSVQSWACVVGVRTQRCTSAPTVCCTSWPSCCRPRRCTAGAQRASCRTGVGTTSGTASAPSRGEEPWLYIEVISYLKKTHYLITFNQWFKAQDFWQKVAVLEYLWLWAKLGLAKSIVHTNINWKRIQSKYDLNLVKQQMGMQCYLSVENKRHRPFDDIVEGEWLQTRQVKIGRVTPVLLVVWSMDKIFTC